MQLEEFDIETVYNTISKYAVDFGFNLLAAILLLLVGLWVIKRMVKGIKKLMIKRQMDESLIPFLGAIIGITLKIVLIISVVGVLGVQTSSFIAIIGSAGLAIGLALQGSLSNFAGGVLLLTLRPINKGDFIQTSNASGTVHLINIFNTVLKTPNNQVVYVPNGQLANSVITNYSQESTRRLVLTFGISYKDDIKKAKEVVQQIIENTEEILPDPEPFIGVSALADSSVNIEIKVWVANEHYWPQLYGLQERVKYAFDENNISIPFPQRDVHVFNNQSA